MLVLISNELQKLFKRRKTWVVFIGFLLFMGAVAFGLYKESENMKKFNTPEYRLQNLKETKESMIKDREEAKKDEEKNPENKKYVEHIDENIKNIDIEINGLEELIKSGKKEDWRRNLDVQIKNSEEMIKDSSMPDKYKERQKLELKQLKYLKEHDIKPMASYEFNSSNFIKVLFQVLGSLFLALGVIVFSSDIVSGECTPPTLKFLLIQPVSRGKVLLSKFISIVLASTALIVFSELLYFVIIGAFKGFGNLNYPIFIGTRYQFDMTQIAKDGVRPMIEVVNSTMMIPMWKYIIYMFLMQILFIISCVAFSFLISSIFKSSMISMSVSIVSLVAITALSNIVGFIKRISQFFFTTYGSVGDLFEGSIAISLQNPKVTISFAVVILIATSIICYVISHIVFNKKDILI